MKRKCTSNMKGSTQIIKQIGSFCLMPEGMNRQDAHKIAKELTNSPQKQVMYNIIMR